MVYGIWYLVHGMREFPKLRGPNMDPKIVRLFLEGHPQKGPPICRNSHIGHCKTASKVYLQAVARAPKVSGSGLRTVRLP